MTRDRRDIRVRYSSIDRCYINRRFRTLEGARRFAARYVGETPEIGYTFNYAVSADGIGKITVDGATLTELFPRSADDTIERWAD